MFDTREALEIRKPVMQADFRKVRIFVASPSDVQSEREQLAKVMNELKLLSSVRALRLTHSEKLRAAVASAKEQFKSRYRGSDGDTSDRFRLLEEAEQELDRPQPRNRPRQR